METERAAAIAAAAITKKEKEESEKEAKEKEAITNQPPTPPIENARSESPQAETAEESGGISFQTIIIIIALLLVVSTVCAKIFFKPQEEGEDFSENNSGD